MDVPQGQVIGELRIPYGDSILILRKAPKDANLLHLQDATRMESEGGGRCGAKVGVVALYVDDILIGAERDVVEGD